MVTQAELTELLHLQGQPDSPILSIYLDVDQTDMSNLNRGFEVTLRNLLNQCESGLAEESKPAFREDAKKVIAYISEYTPQHRTLIVYCDVSTDLFWARSIRVPLPNRCFWERRPYLRPLFEAQDEYERYGVILTDRAHARLFTVSFGEMEENKEALAGADVKRFDSSSSDHLLSQSTFQRNAEEHAKWHLKHVAEMMERLAAEQRFDRLVLAGPKEAVAKLQDLLSPNLQKRVIGTMALAVNAKETDILEATNRLVAQRERQDEASVVERLLTAAAKQQQAVIGLPSTIEAAMEGRIMSLVYTDDYAENPGNWRDDGTRCQQILAASGSAADHSVTSSGDLLEWLVVQVARQGGHVEQVRDGAADALTREGRGIGAFLRF